MNENSSKQILVVDDEKLITDVLSNILIEQGYMCQTTIDPFAALDMIKAEPYALVLCDIRMPKLNGIELMKKVKETKPDIDFIMVTAVGTADMAIKAIRMGAHDYITKPFDAEEIIASVNNAFKNREKREISSTVHNMMGLGTLIAQPTDKSINSLASALAQSLHIVAKLFGVDKEYSRMVIEHSRQVAISAGNVAEKMKLPLEERGQIVSAALLHDIGKMGMPPLLLTTPYDNLNLQDKRMYETHPVRGEAIVEPFKPLSKAALFIKHHHEKYGGSGYPDGLKGENIPIGSRIIAIADAHERNKYLSQQGEEPHIRDDTGELFDPKVVKLFFKYNIKKQEEERGYEK